MATSSSGPSSLLSAVIWGLLGVILGGGMLMAGLNGVVGDGPPTCGGQTMERGDECVGTKSGRRDYDEVKRSDRTSGYFLTGFGLLIGLGGVVVLASGIRDRHLVTVTDDALLGAGEVARFTGLPGTVTESHGAVLFDDTEGLDDPELVSVYSHAQVRAFQRPGMATVRTRTLREEPEGRLRRAVSVAVVGYTKEAQAQTVFAELGRQWSAAPGRTLGVRRGAEHIRSTVGTLFASADTLVISRQQEDGDGWTGWHAVARWNNVLVEVQANGYWEQPGPTADLLDAAVAKLSKGAPRPATRTLLPVESPAWSAEALEALLLPDTRVGELLRAPALARESVRTSLYDDASAVHDGAFLGTYALTQKSVFDGSGWQAMRGRVLHDADGGPVVRAIQAVVLMPSAQAAGALLAAQAPLWQRQAGAMMSFSSGEQRVVNSYGPLVNTGDMLAINRFEEGGNGWVTQRAMTAVGRIIVDTQVAGRPAAPTLAVQLADAIAAGVPGAGGRRGTRDPLALQPAPVEVAAAEALLPTAERAAALTGTPGLVLDAPVTALYDDSAQLPAGDPLDPWALAQLPVYTGTGYLAVRTHKLSVPVDGGGTHLLFGSVIVFATPAAAAAALAAQRPNWRGAVGRLVTTGDDAGEYTWVYGELAEAPDALALTHFQEGADGWGVQRAVRLAGNVLIEAQASGRWAAGVAGRFAAAIAAGVPAAAAAPAPAPAPRPPGPPPPSFDYGVQLLFDTTGLDRGPDGWVNPGTGDDFRIAELAGNATSLPLARLDELRRSLTTDLAGEACLIEANVVAVDGLPALQYLIKAPNPRTGRGVVYLVANIVPREGKWLQLNGIFPEGADTGMREAAVAAEVGPAGMYPPHPYVPGVRPVLPYSIADDRRYDGRFPDHPVSRARRWAAAVPPTIRLAPGFAALPPAYPEDRR